jgi:REP element-mobilizing transposase RayT
MRHDNFIHTNRVFNRRSRGRLPHWELDESNYSITFRLRDSLPRSVAEMLFRERQHMLQTALNAAERAEADRMFSLRLDTYLDAGYGTCILREDRNAAIVAGALKHFDRVRYDLHAWCVMPNHVHAMFYLARGADLQRVLHSWKSYTAHEIGQGVIWQREYFDRIVRDERDFRDTRNYVLNNPAKAGLRNWKWVGYGSTNGRDCTG